MHTLRILRPHLSSQRSVLTVAGASTLLLVLAEIAKPFPLKFVVDHLLAASRAARPFRIDSGDLLLLAAVAGMVLAIAAVEAAAAYQMQLRLLKVGERVAHSLRVAVYAHLQRLSIAFHDRSRQGDLVTRTTGDVQAVGQLFAESIGRLTSAVLLLVGMLVVSLLIDPLLALAAFSISPVLAALTFVTRRRVKAAARQQRAKEGEIASLASETLFAMRAIKALGSEGHERNRLERVSEEREAAGVEAGRIEGQFAGAVDVLGSCSLAVVLVVGVFRVASGAISPGDLVVMASYARRIQGPLRDLARETGRVARGLVRAERVAAVLASDEVLPEPAQAYHGPRVAGDLALEGVSFAYAPDRPVLADLSLRVPAGRKVALVGPSGAGKSTIAALVARFYDPDAGRITLDGHDLRDCSLQWLRAQVGLVLQDTLLFTGSVADNIAYGTDATNAEVERAARGAGAHDFITRLPDGYRTLLGPRGLALSGGQRQRIAVARTLLRDPPVVVLDEPTAALDPQAEAEVLAGLRRLLPGRTTLIISHSAALAGWADDVVTIDAGRVAAAEPAGRTRGAPTVTPDPAMRRPRPVPLDSALPHMRQLLDAATVAEVFRRALEPEPPDAPAVEVRYLRYKPHTNLVVQYEVERGGERNIATAMIASRDYLARRARKPANVALAAKIDGRSPSSRPLTYDPEIGCLIQWYPLDLALPALAESPPGMRHRLASNGVDPETLQGEPELLAYKPRRRAVLRLGDSVIKAYASETAFLTAAVALMASSELHGVPAPRVQGALASLRLTAQSFLPGRPVTDALATAGPAAALVAMLHANAAPRRPLPTADPVRQLYAAAASARLVAIIEPSLERRVSGLIAELERDLPAEAEPIPAHGDFNARQLLVGDEGLALTDFDELCLAPPALDLATYVAYVARGQPGADEAATTVLTRLLDGYGRRPRDLSWYLSSMLLRRSPRPFRYFEPDWPRKVEAMVSLAEAARTW